MSTNLQGQTLGKYRLLELLGRGGMAQVYRAYHPHLKRYVALKVMRADLAEEAEFVARFHREAQAVAALRHPNIVQVFDFDVQDERYYMVMELLAGDTLKARLADCRAHGERMDWGEAVRVALDVLAGLAYAHGAGMIHRDIKPSNILLTQNGQAVLSDFGIAHIIGGTQYTASGAFLGTVEYMAPEQGLRGYCDARSDLYALGVVLYELLAQEPPFSGETPLAVLMEHVNTPPPALRERVPDAPEALEQVILTALAKEPAARYQSAAAMSSALRAAVTDAAIPLPATLHWTRPPTPIQEHTEAAAQVYSGAARAQLAASGFVAGDTAPATTVAPPRQPGRVGRAILLALALWGFCNLTALTAEVLDEGTLFTQGWPLEFLLIACALCIIMVRTECIWLLIPVVLLLGNGALLALTALNDGWHLWDVLWVFELWLLALGIIPPFLLRRKETAQRFSRLLGWGLGLIGWSLALYVAMLALQQGGGLQIFAWLQALLGR